MLKYKISLIIIFIFILTLSCTESLVKATIWVGKFKSDNNVDYDVEIYFEQNNYMRIFLTWDYDDDGVDDTFSATGSYTITNKDAFVGFADINVPTGLARLKMVGVINYYNNSGYGYYDLRDKTTTILVDEGDYTLTRITSM